MLGLDIGLELVLGFELVFRLGLGLVMTVQISTIQISYGYPFIFPLFRSQFVTNNTKFAPTLYWIIIR